MWLGRADSQIQNQRITEYPDMEGTLKDHGSPTPGPAQDIRKSHSMCLRALSKLFFNSDRLSTGRPVPEPSTSGHTAMAQSPA